MIGGLRKGGRTYTTPNANLEIVGLYSLSISQNVL